MTLLLLAGTGEAQQIARHLAERDRPVIASLAGATRAPRDMPVAVRSGGFGGDAGFCAFLQEADISAVLDATHPFAARISNRTARICAGAQIPYCYVLRPGWTAQSGDRWTMVDREEDVERHIAKGLTVFLATGRQTLDRFANLTGRRLICRQIDPPDREFPFENGRFLIGRPPFSVAQETALFRDLQIDWLVVKNAGGMASATKLTAARDLGLEVAMINRPVPPDAPIVPSVAAALAWVDAL